jgi:hypothetical protein
MVEHARTRATHSPLIRPPAQETIRLKPCPDGHPDHRLIEVDAETTEQLDLPLGSLLHLNMQRRPANDDIVLAAVVLRERLARTLRRFTVVGGSHGVVSLAPLGAAAGRTGSIVRPRYEVGVVGVVDGHIVHMPDERAGELAGELADAPADEATNNPERAGP